MSDCRRSQYTFLPLDPKIKEIVVALNALGVKTHRSCEGHMDRALPYPWIDIDINTEENRALRRQIKQLSRAISKEEKKLKRLYPYLTGLLDQPEEQTLSGLCKQRYATHMEIVKTDKLILESLYNLLNQFYQNHHCPYDQMLYFAITLEDDENNEIFIRLQNMGGDWYMPRSDEEKQEKLIDYQNEMNAFAAFLKERFFQVESSLN